MNFLIVFFLGLASFFLLERKKFLQLSKFELMAISFAIGLALLTTFGLVFQLGCVFFGEGV